MSKFSPILALLFSSSLALATDNKPSSETRASETEREFVVPVPQSEIKLEPLRYTPPKPTEFAFGVSNWAPSNFTRGSYTGETSSFQRSSTPALTINRFQPFANWQNGVTLSSKFGLTYLGLERTTNRSIGPITAGSSTENLNMFMARVGVEASWSGLLPGAFEPNVSFAFLPTWMSGEKSQYEDDVGVFGIPYEATAGILWRAVSGPSHFGNLSFGLSGQEVSGSLGGSSMTGFGILGEMRVTL